MPKKIELKTILAKLTVAGVLNKVANRDLKSDVKKLLVMFRDITGKPARVWGSSIIGFGSFTYHRKNGDEGKFFMTGFAVRKDHITLYIMPGYDLEQSTLNKLGPHKHGKSCLHIKSLSDVNIVVLKKLIADGVKKLRKTHEVH